MTIDLGILEKILGKVLYTYSHLLKHFFRSRRNFWKPFLSVGSDPFFKLRLRESVVELKSKRKIEIKINDRRIKIDSFL